MRALGRSRLVVAGVGLLAGLLLLSNTASAIANIRLPQLPRARFWDDLTIAIGSYQADDFRVLDEEEGVQGILPTYETRVLKMDLPLHLGGFIKRRMQELGASGRAWEFWKTVPFRLKPALRHRGRPVPSALEDPGRSALLALAFRIRGGIAPFLLLWLAPLCAVPLLIWCACELAEAGFWLAGVLYPFLLASSSYVLGTLFMTHSAAGFYLLGLLLLVPLSFQSRAVRSLPGLGLRVLLGGLFFALSCLCRGGVLLLLPAFLLAILLGAWRASAGPWSRTLATGLGACAVFLLPFLLVKPPERHSTWLGVWEGLGDFDREKGYFWDGEKAQEAILRAGGASVRRISLCSPFIGGGYELDIFPRPEEFQVLRRAVVDQEAAYESVARDMVLRELAQDPGWYLRILCKRLFWTVTQRKLWPYGPRDGISLEPATSPHEGSIDHYYHYTPEADMFVVSGHVHELPVLVLLLPTALLVLLGIPPLRGRILDAEGTGAALEGVGLVSLGALALPVLITTGGAQETEAFVLVHLLCLALLIDLVLRGRPAGPRREVEA